MEVFKIILILREKVRLKCFKRWIFKKKSGSRSPLSPKYLCHEYVMIANIICYYNDVFTYFVSSAAY